MFRKVIQGVFGLSHKAVTRAERGSQPARSSRPTLRALEQRDCPASALFWDGSLVVLGSPIQGDAIQVVTQGHDLVVLDGEHEILRRPAATVTDLTVITGIGDDKVTLNLTETGGVLAPSLSIDIATTLGDDQVNCTCENVATKIDATVDLGGGDDRLVGTSINARATAADVEHIVGGPGDDRIECVQINPAGAVDTVMSGGAGSDTLFGNLVGSQATADLSFTADGGAGADRVDLLAEGAVHGQLDFDIQGGEGADLIGLAFDLAAASTPGTLPPSTIVIRGSVSAGAGKDVVTVDPGNPFNLAQVQFPALMQFDGGSGTDTINVLNGVPLEALPINPISF